jgi:hypothetical protein
MGFFSRLFGGVISKSSERVRDVGLLSGGNVAALRAGIDLGRGTILLLKGTYQ